MKGDFTRNTFNRNNHYSRVLMQQGRVQLDADWNEQAYILLDYLRTLARDLIGPHGGSRSGFKIGPRQVDDRAVPCDFAIYPGHYYVDGILCAIDPEETCPLSAPEPLAYTAQPDYPLRTKENGDVVDADKLATDTTYLVYLDVWERHITYLQDPYIREVALGGPDTATRAKTVCQVKVWTPPDKSQDATADCRQWLTQARRKRYACLRARALIDKPLEEPCTIPPQARYRGAENQLYRVEIHDGGMAGKEKGGATFKWSRDNGSVVFAIRSLQGTLITVDDLGPDNRRSLEVGDWVEITDDVYELRGDPGPLLKVEAIDPVAMTVTLQVPQGTQLPTYTEESTTHPLLRRWESKALPIVEGKWTELEDGVQVYFSGDSNSYFKDDDSYHTGDYWIIPARTATGDVEWPGPPDNPTPRPPRGIRHHYAPLAIIRLDSSGNISQESIEDCRCVIEQLCPSSNIIVQPPGEKSEEEVALAQVYYQPNEVFTEKREGMAKNFEMLAHESQAQARIVGYATTDEVQAAKLAADRAHNVMQFYIEGGIEHHRLTMASQVVVVGNADPNTLRRVDTFLIRKRETVPGEEKPVDEREKEEAEKRAKKEAEEREKAEAREREKAKAKELEKAREEAKRPAGDVATPIERPSTPKLVSAISGVGPKYTKLLNEANITDAAEVARMDAVKLAGILNVPTSRAETIIAGANEIS